MAEIPFLWIAVLAPILLSPLVYWLGSRANERTGWIAFAILLYPLIISTYALLSGKNLVDPLISISPIVGSFGMLTDGLSAPIFFIISLLSAILAVYSIPYMKHRIEEGKGTVPGYGPFYALFVLYFAGMAGTVLSTNLLSFFLFFELMLIPSFFLIALWGYGERVRISFMYLLWTHVGAVILLLGILATGFFGNTFDIGVLTAFAGLSQAWIPEGAMRWVGAAIMLGLLVKMSVFALHIWLPYAHAEAPTPVSAVLSPAMVGIGGYAIVRIVGQIYLPFLQDISLFLMGWALVTMVYGGFMALKQDDFKKLLAYSTVSQMGYMLLGIASLQPLGITGGIFQYVSHGAAKGLLFMVAGSIILQGNGLRSIRGMGGFAKIMPYTAIAGVIGFLTLAGAPPFMGFQSEWMLFKGALSLGLGQLSISAVMLGVAALASTALTAGYGVWTIRRIFFGPYDAAKTAVSEAPRTMIAPLLVLIAVTILLGIFPQVVVGPLYSYATTLLGG